MAELIQREWLDMVAREGTSGAVAPPGAVPAGADAEGEPPCPACGVAAPLVDGECSECGLYLGG